MHRRPGRTLDTNIGGTALKWRFLKAILPWRRLHRPCSEDLFMSLRYALVAMCLVLGAARSAPRAQGQEAPPAKDAEQAPPSSTWPAIIEIELLLAEWATVPPEAGKETPNELSGSSDEVAQRVAALEKARKLTVLERFRLTTLEGSKAYMQWGESVPVTRGVTIGNFGTTRNVVDQHVGTIVMVTPV